MFHRQVYTFLICLIYFLELLLCYISVPLMWVRMEEGKKRKDCSDLILLLKHFTSEMGTGFLQKVSDMIL